MEHSVEHWMAEAISLGRQGDPSPNPHTGCVVVRDNTVVGRGYHDRTGTPHAERVALAQAGELARGATLFCTLEPCNHHGRTPPCTEAIIQAGISRVVVGCSDPNPNVPGGGLAALQAAGISVEFALSEACDSLIRPWRSYILNQSAYLTLKMAISLDGRIAAKTGVSKWITSEESRARAQRLRATHDAVLVGVSTVVADDPQLTVRCGPPATNPIRVVVDSRLRIPLTSKLVTTASELPTCVVTTPDSSEVIESELVAAGVNVIRVPANAQGRCDMTATLKALADREVVSVLCEGGAELSGSLIADELASEAHLFIAPLFLGPRGRPCAVDWAGPEEPFCAPQIDSPRWEVIGKDIYLSGLLRYPTR